MRQAIVLLFAVAASAAAQPASASRHAVVRSVGVGEVRLTGGFWADRWETCRTSTIPAMARLMEGTEPSSFLHNFRIAAGEAEGRHRGPAWNDGDFYKWIEAASAVLAVAPHAELDRRLEEAIRVVAKAQRDDGYLHTPVLIKVRNGDTTARPFEDRLNFEMYNFGHLMTAACVHHRATGKKTLLDVAVKAADFLCDAFKRPTPELARNSVCPSHYMGAVELYRTTGQKKYLALAETFLAMRDLVDGGSDDNQDRVPFKKQTEAVGHAVRANYLYAGAADLYAETGDRTLLEPLRKIWDDVVSRKMSLTGACGALYDGASPDGSKDQKQIARTHQAYGRPYQLPNSTAHNETCAAIGNILWNARMLAISGEAKYADVMERTMYNALLAGVSLDGTRFFYTNTLRQLDTMPVALRWSRTRQSWISCFCCPPNVARTIAEVGTYAYGRSDDAIWVHLYGSGTLDTTLNANERFALTQESDYPWDGRVRITVRAAPSRPVTLFLRVPAWAKGATLSVKGERQSAPEPGRYVSVRRTWAVGDIVKLELPMRVRLIQAHPLAEELRGQVAVQRGPVVYCVESPDLPKGVAVSDVVLSRGIDLRLRQDKFFLGGVGVLEGEATAVVEAPWAGTLYRDLDAGKERTISLRLIPYYAWGNRGSSEMTVWLPLRR